MSDDITFTRQYDPVGDGNVRALWDRLGDKRPSFYGWKPSHHLINEARLGGLVLHISEYVERGKIIFLGPTPAHTAVIGILPRRGVPHEVRGYAHDEEAWQPDQEFTVFERAYLLTHGGGWSTWLDAATGRVRTFTTRLGFSAIERVTKVRDLFPVIRADAGPIDYQPSPHGLAREV